MIPAAAFIVAILYIVVLVLVGPGDEYLDIQ